MSSTTPACLFGNVPHTKLPKCSIEATTHIGLRPAQEDRVVVCPRLAGDQVSFCGVFDGTVGFEASEYIQQNIVKYLVTDDLPFLKTPEGGAAPTEVSESESAERKSKVGALLRNAFMKSDAGLIQMCTERGGLDYASSTGVGVLLWPNNMLSVAHVGDSRACLGRVVKRTTASGAAAAGAETLHCEWLTVDHKPDQPAELKRIQEAGGSLVYLHGNKPFIRGGDFLQRQALGQHPKQLNYSRAFGGKDLKPYGLSVDPSISHRHLIPHEDRFVIIASDGLWDTLPLRNICEVAWKAYSDFKAGVKPHPASKNSMHASITATNASAAVSNEIIATALHHMPMTTVRDNISCIVVVFEWDAAAKAPVAVVGSASAAGTTAAASSTGSKKETPAAPAPPVPAASS